MYVQLVLVIDIPSLIGEMEDVRGGRQYGLPALGVPPLPPILNGEIPILKGREMKG